MLQRRTTKQRLIILNTLRKLKNHPSADEIYSLVKKEIPNISLGTVYRNLEILLEEGNIKCFGKAGHQRRFDGNISPHHHIRCEICSELIDLKEPINLPTLSPKLTEDFCVKSVEVEFVGVCSSCQKKQA